MKVIIALRFYAVGTFYETLGDLFNISRTSVETIIEEVSYLISTTLRDRYIYMPTTDDNVLKAKADFMRLSHFPLCIAAIDGTHIDVISFGGPDAEVYRNRKMRFSLNVQLAVSANVSTIYRENTADSFYHKLLSLCPRN